MRKVTKVGLLEKGVALAHVRLAHVRFALHFARTSSILKHSPEEAGGSIHQPPDFSTEPVGYPARVAPLIRDPPKLTKRFMLRTRYQEGVEFASSFASAIPPSISFDQISRRSSLPNSRSMLFPMPSTTHPTPKRTPSPEARTAVSAVSKNAQRKWEVSLHSR